MPALVSTKPIVQSPADEKQYRHITLPNELQALLIHDPTIIVSGAPTPLLYAILNVPCKLAHPSCSMLHIIQDAKASLVISICVCALLDLQLLPLPLLLDKA